jgi:hypothetical protein
MGLVYTTLITLLLLTNCRAAVKRSTQTIKKVKKSKGNKNAAIYPDAQPTYSSKDGELSVTLTLGQAIYKSDSLTQKVVGYNGHLGGPTLRVKRGKQSFIDQDRSNNSTFAFMIFMEILITTRLFLASSSTFDIT